MLFAQINLRKNKIGVEGAKALAAGLAAKACASVTECNLCQNNLGVEGWTIVFNALRDSKITTWDLSREGLGPEIAKPLGEYVSVAASVQSVR